MPQAAVATPMHDDGEADAVAAQPAPKPGLVAAGDMTPDAVLAALRDLAAGENVETVANGIGCHAGTLSKLLAGKTAWSERLLAQARAYLAVRAMQAADAGGAADLGAVAPTRSVRDVARVCAYCQAEQVIGIIEGESGSGKTVGLLAYQRTNPAAVYVHGCYAINSPLRLLAALWQRAGFRYHGSTRPGRGRPRSAPTVREQFDQLVDRWRVPAGKPSARVLLIDDAHVLTFPALELLRELHDASRIAVVLAGTTRLEERVSAHGDSHQMYEQLRGRCMIRRTLRPSGAADAAAVAAAWAPSKARFTAEARAFLADLAGQLGGLRLVKAHVRLVGRLASKFRPADGEAVDLVHLERARKLLADLED
jgi:DNA transposition AAA+ family ATPase